MRRPFALVLVTLMTSACTQMQVRVHVLEQECLGRRNALQTAALVQANLAGGVYDRAQEDVQRLVSKYVATLKGDLMTPGAYVVTDEQASRYESALDGKVAESFGRARSLYEDGVALARRGRADTHGARASVLYADALSRFDAGDVVLGELANAIVEESRKQIGPDQMPAVAVAQLRRSVQQETTSAQSNSGLLTTDLNADVVAHAPTSCWGGPMYNKAYGFGSFGNTDVAIRMEDVGSYTLKGVRVDATKVTQATFTALKQAIQIAAAAYGVPLPMGSGGSTTDSSVPDLSDISAAPVKQQQAESDARRLRGNILRLMTAIVPQGEKIGGDDQQRAAAINSIKKTYAAYRSLLASDSTTSSSTTAGSTAGGGAQ
jgi:hypothetical protein